MKIKRFTLLSLSVSVLSIGAFVGFTSEKVGKYSERASLEGQEQSSRIAKGSAMEFIQSLRANVKTGTVSVEEVAEARKQFEKNKLAQGKAVNMAWQFMGPDNVGGRTRTLIIDKNDPKKLYAGSTSGGIFVSTNGGNSWTSYSDDLENNAIASMVQAANGDIYFSTGPLFDNPYSDNVENNGVQSIFIGTGIYKLTGNGNSQKLVGPQVDNSPNAEWAMTSKMAADPADANAIYAGTNKGFRYTHDAGASWKTPTGISHTGAVNDIEVASDGTIMVTFSKPGKLYTSTDKGVTFQEITGTPLIATDARVEYAIAPSDVNVHYMVAAGVASNKTECLRGVYQSTDKGQTWDRIIGPSMDRYNYFFNGYDCFGDYSNSIAVYPNDPHKILLGGYSMFRWEQSTFPPAKPNGSMIELGVLFPGTPYTISPFIHGFFFASDSTVYITNDGGIERSNSINEMDPTQIFFNSINYGYTTAQYFSVGVGPKGLLLGGTQGSGTNIVGYSFNQGKSAVRAVPKEDQSFTFTLDGFDANMSNLDPSIAFGSMPYGQVRKITGISQSLSGSNFDLNTLYGEDIQVANKCDFQCGTYYTAARLWESFYDPTAKSTVTFTRTLERGESIAAGTTLQYESMTNAIPLYYKTTQSYSGPVRIDSTVVKGGDTIVYPKDTLIQFTATDYVQSVMAVGNIEYNENTGQNYVWMTRHAIHGNGENPTDWISIAGPADGASQSVAIQGAIISMEFSKDGNHLFVGTARKAGGGDFYRISGISNVYSDQDGTLNSNRKTSTTLLASFGQGGVSGIAVDPNNPENVIITIGNYGHSQHVYRSTSAVTSTFPGSFVSIMGTGTEALPNAPVFDALIDYHNKDTVLVGTDFGVFVSHNAFSANPNDVKWTAANNGLPAVPVYAIRQQTFGYGDSSRGITNTGEVYIATHGRGLFKSGDLVGINEWFSDNAKDAKFESSLSIYPNPAVDKTYFKFSLPTAGKVQAKIYNIYGVLVREANYGSLSSGEHKVQIDARELPTGTYILQVTTGSSAATGKFIIQK